MNQRLQGTVLKTRFFLIAAFVWLFWVLLQFSNSGFSWLPVIYAMLVVGCGYLTLLLCGVFDGFRIRFEVRDSVLIAAVMFGVSFSLHLLLYGTLAAPLVLTALQCLVGAVCLAVGVWYFELLRDFPLGRGRPFRVVLDIEDEEKRERTRLLLEEHWVNREVDFYDRDTLKRYRSIFRDGVAFDLVVTSRVHKRTMLDQVELLDIHLKGVPVVERAALEKAITGRVTLSETDMWLFLAEANPQSRLLRFVRALRYGAEPLFAAVLLTLLSPVVFLTALVVKVTSRGPILFKQKRLGYRGREFTVYKFRTMSIDAERNGPQFSGYEDDRLTVLGKFLRTSRLDEFPQLYNVMRGEMSFIGPRPERPEMYDLLKREIPLFPLRLLVRPGITGWAQIQYGYASGVEESIFKLEYDLFYIQNMSLSLDVKVFFLTILAIIGGVRAERAREREAKHMSKSVPPLRAQ